MDTNFYNSIQCFWGNLKKHPRCPHGPTLLFGYCIGNEWEKFFICSACRDRHLCSFYLKQGETLSNKQKKLWEQKSKNLTSLWKQQELYIRFHQIMAEHPLKRFYCHKCESLFKLSEKEKHKDHDIIENLSDYQMLHPTEILKPLTTDKKEAQYLFSKKSTRDIVDFLSNLGAEQVLCIGAPRIYEYIINSMADKMTALLLDIDGRFHNFYSPLSYCWYNLFNHYFFFDNAKTVFKEFITQNTGRNMYLVCDPPFGARVEAMSQTVKKISDCYKKWNKLKGNEELKIFFIFPYFMESTLKYKSNPAGVVGGLSGLEMMEYQVEYDNHPLFVKRNSDIVFSPVRIFTNVPLNLFNLSKLNDYKYCKKCNRWVISTNEHCEKCKTCTSKNGKNYKHCDICKRCVKRTWEHCYTCHRCNFVKHQCGQRPITTGFCLKCNIAGHTANTCKVRDTWSFNLKVRERRKMYMTTDCDENNLYFKKLKK